MERTPVPDHAAEARDPGPRGAATVDVRSHNERLVLTIVRRFGPLPKAQIARMSGLSAQTASVIVRALEADGLLLRHAPVRGKVGQPSVPIALDPDGARFFGLKIGRRSADLVLTDFLGRVTKRASRVHFVPLPEDTVRFALTEIRAMLSAMTGRERSRVAGLGIAMPFFLWSWARHLGVPEADMAGWHEADIRGEIAAALDFPVYLQNDASAACGAELVFGPPDGPRDFLYFYIGYFIGGGLVLDGKLFTGRGNAGALGPLPVPDGSGGTCQLLDIASLSRLETDLRTRGDETAGIWREAEGWQVDDATLADWMRRTAAALAHAIVSAISVVDVEAVRIDGWLPAKLRSDLVEAVRAAMARMDLTGLTPPRIEAGAVGPDARALGAASLPLSERFLVNLAQPLAGE